MVKKITLFLAIFLLSLNYSNAQQKETVVDAQDAVAFGVKSAKLTSFITKTDNKYEEKFQLSFSLPDNFESSLNRAKLMLTAYKSDGSIFGRQIWCSGNLGKAEKNSVGFLQFTLDVNAKFVNADKYSLTMVEKGNSLSLNDNGTTCQQCVSLANDTCGRGNVGSVTCGAEGECSFTCK